MLKLKNFSKSNGYLLLEAIVSIAVIAIGLAIILRSFASSLRASKISEEYLVASSILKDKMWELERKARPEPEGEGGLTESETTEQIPNSNYILDIKVKESDSLNEVKATISWQSGNRNEKIEVVTYLKYKEGGP
ncbi:MAG: type II secretion system protein [Candidatus Omnitrophota bacterium]